MATDDEQVEARGMTRRRFQTLLAAAVAGMAAVVTGCASWLRRGARGSEQCAPAAGAGEEYEYVVVGSGAGGGPLAANLARAGHRVLLLEAGGDDEPYSYQVPVFHPSASEDPALRWDFFVRHYADDARQRRDSKYDAAHDGVFYPRSGTLGGCTAHNAMITVCPDNRDWDAIAELFGDPSWSAERMRKYFERIEACEYVNPVLHPLNSGRHGFDGWLTTSMADPRLLLHDQVLVKLVKATGEQSLGELGGFFDRVLPHLHTKFDPNDWRTLNGNRSGFFLTPVAIKDGRRNGTREYIRRVQASCPGNLVVRTHALATRVLLDAENRAVGLEYLEGPRLYRADRDAVAGGPEGVRRSVRASREVILSGGAFNSPQLLKLSGIGPRAELERHGIPVRVPLAGVGENLQDRYEVGVVSQLKEDLAILRGATFSAPTNGAPPDPLFRQWERGEGVYGTNGVIAAVVRSSAATRPAPDLFMFGLAGYFKGYYVGYSNEIKRGSNFFTWAILKAHTRNSAGQVLLRSTDPRDTPLINFRYFDEGNDTTGEDLDSVVEGIQHVRELNRRLGDYMERELIPGPDVRTPEQLREFVKNEAWGHHASCTNQMGRRGDPMAVVDNEFRVHGVKNLRVVDASVFPRIPGFFIVTSVYMISEKASDVILEAARGTEA